MIESTARAERVNLQSVSSPAYSWEVPEKPVCVRMPLTLIDRLEKEVVENFRSLTSRGSEIGGILLGAVGPGNPTIVTVDDYEALACDYSRGPLYRLSDADMGRFERAIEQRQSGGGFRVVGFFRSHTRKGLSLDAEDLSFFCARFRDPHHVALLIRPFATKASTAGFFIWENGTVQGEASHLEFPFRSSQLSPSSAGASSAEAFLAPSAPAVSPAAAAPPPAPAVPKPATRAQIVPIASRREVTLPAPPEPAETKQPEAKAPATPPAPSRPAAPVPTQARPAATAPAAPAPGAKSAVTPAAPSPTPVPAAPAPAAKSSVAPAAPAPAAKSNAAPAAPAPAAKPSAAPGAPAASTATPARPAAAPSSPAGKEPEKPKEVDKSKEKAAAPAGAPAKRPDWDKSKDKDKAKPAETAKVQEAQKAETKTEPKAEVKAEAKEQKAAAAAQTADKPAMLRGKTMMFAMIALAALAAIMVLFVYPGVLRHAGSAPGNATADLASLSLRVERTGTDVLLTWNRDSSAIQKAQHAVLTISDGDRHENYDMDVSQLRNGSIVYSPLTADVSFKMEVTGANNAKTASESVRVLRTRPSPMPDGSQPPVDTTVAAKTNVKPGQPAVPSAPVNSPAGAPPGNEPAAQEEAPVASKAGAPVKPFNTASLAQRLRPATSSDVPLPDAPVLTNSPVAPTAAPSFGSTIAPPPSRPTAASAAAPSVPAPPPASTASDRRPAAGGQITQAQVVFSKQPEYPKLARQMGVKGSVEVVATIGTDGRVKSVKVEKGHPLLVKAATDAVMQWVYKPTLLNGVPVQNDTHITLNFMGDK